MRRAATPHTPLGWARLAGSSAATLTTGGLAAWAVWSLLVFGDFARPGAGLLPVVAVAQALIAPMALLGVLSPRPRLSAFVLLVSFVGSFIFAFGWYLLLLPFPLVLIGVGNLLYLVSAVTMVGAALAEQPHQE